MQEQPPPPAPAPIINLDFGPLLSLLQQVLDAVNPTVWVPLMIQALGELAYTAVRSLLITMWQATLLGIPHELTDRFAPVVAMMPPAGGVAVSGLVLALALLGIRTYARAITGGGSVLDEVLGRVMVYTSVLSMLPWIIGRAIDLEQQMAAGLAGAAIEEILPAAIGQGMPFDMALVLSFLIMLVLGLRLWLKLASNVIHVAVAIVWSPLALVCGLIPETSWVASLWWREFGGRLMGAVLATIAVGIGFAIAVMNSGILVVTGVAAAFMAAHDLVDWLARTPGSSMGGVLGAGLGLAGRLGGGGAGGPSAAATAAAMRSMSRSDAASSTQRFYSYD